MRVTLLFAILTIANCKTYEPGTPGATWSPEVAAIIRNKLFHLWRNDILKKNVEKFDLMVHDGPNGNPGYTDYLFEPDRRLSEVDCVDPEETQCKSSWLKNVRLDDLSFTPSKAIRLAFHDCMPYIDGTGGCDGCINFEENVVENDVLQHSVAILEKMYLEADYPEGAPTLDKSPKELGISRADLWSFAGVLALDEASRRSRAYCDTFNQKLTCGDFSPCFLPFPEKFESLFKTGRSDCKSHSDDPKKQYLAPISENSPHAVANGPQTAAYFRDEFGLTPRESLALMGAHTLGKYSTFHTHIDYAWVRARGGMRHRLLNNEYYKSLTAEDGHVKDEYCVGKLDGSPATKEWHVFANLFEYAWPQEIKGSDWKQRHRRFLWHHEVTRGPNCNATDEDSEFRGMQTPWIEYDNANPDFQVRINKLKNIAKANGFDSGYDYCCNLQSKGQNDDNCNQPVQNRIRHLSSDLGFYYKFKFNWDGLPIGCSVFDKPASWSSNKKPNRWSWYYASELPGPAGCPLQDMSEEENNNGKPIYKTVEEYADNLDIWLEDFVDVWEKMSQNGNSGLEDGPEVLTSRCCIHSSVKYIVGDQLESKQADSTLACQTACKEKQGCGWFLYDTKTKNCSLLKEKPVSAEYNGNNWLAGPASCSKNENSCNAYLSI